MVSKMMVKITKQREMSPPVALHDGFAVALRNVVTERIGRPF
jgi:hypothetical protein